MLPEASTQQLKEVIATRLGLKTDQEISTAVTFFNSSVDFVMARSNNSDEVLKHSDRLIMVISGCLSLFRDIADTPDKVMEQYKKFSENHLNQNGNGK